MPQYDHPISLKIVNAILQRGTYGHEFCRQTTDYR